MRDEVQSRRDDASLGGFPYDPFPSCSPITTTTTTGRRRPLFSTKASPAFLVQCSAPALDEDDQFDHLRIHAITMQALGGFGFVCRPKLLLQLMNASMGLVFFSFFLVSKDDMI